MNKAELRHRVEQFASLQAAHRALAGSVHPSELAPLREESRDLLIRLQALGSRVREGGGDGEPPAPADASLEQVDRALADQSKRTREILLRTDLIRTPKNLTHINNISIIINSHNNRTKTIIITCTIKSKTSWYKFFMDFFISAIRLFVKSYTFL